MEFKNVEEARQFVKKLRDEGAEYKDIMRETGRSHKWVYARVKELIERNQTVPKRFVNQSGENQQKPKVADGLIPFSTRIPPEFLENLKLLKNFDFCEIKDVIIAALSQYFSMRDCDLKEAQNRKNELQKHKINQ